MGWVSVCKSFWMHLIIELSGRKINASCRSIESNSIALFTLAGQFVSYF